MNEILTLQIGGLPVPDAGPVFLAALGVHVLAATAAVVAGALAATARKRPGRHPKAGTVYLYAVTVVFGTATVMAVLRWRQDWYLFVLATVAFGLALLGWWVRRRRQLDHWMAWHGSAMAGSYVALFTGFYVDNGPHLPLWDRLPHLAYWLIPVAIGVPVTWCALLRNGAFTANRTRPARGIGSSVSQRDGRPGSQQPHHP